MIVTSISCIIFNIAIAYIIIMIGVPLNAIQIQTYAFVVCIFLPFACVILWLAYFFYSEAHSDDRYHDKDFVMSIALVLCFCCPIGAILYLCQRRNLRAQYFGCLNCFLFFFGVTIGLLALAFAVEINK